MAERIVITGVGLAAPNGNDLRAYRANLLKGVSGVQRYNIRYVGDTLAGLCNFDPLVYQKRKDLRTGTRAGSLAIYAANEAIRDARLPWAGLDRSRVGVYLGITEHGNVETEHEIHELAKYNYDIKFWSHYHNPRTVANNPAGEVTINLGITGPHYTLGAACAAGNLGCIQGCQQLILGEVDVALAGGVSESVRTFGIFASFKSQGALAAHEDPAKASRPFDLKRNGIVVAEGSGVFVLERLGDALKRGADIYGEVSGYAVNSDATDFVLPNATRQAECIAKAIARAGITPADVDLISTHATGTKAGDIQECEAINKVFGPECRHTCCNNTKSYIGHAMGAAAILELAGNLPSFQDRVVHPTINIDEPDPECRLPNLVMNRPRSVERVDTILNNAFGMVGINSVLLIRRYST